MKKLLATGMLILAMPVLAAEQSPVNPGDAFSICMQATARFEQQEKDKAKNKATVSSLSAACKTELKPVAYWQCMDKEAIEQIDFNSAHTRCMQQTPKSN